MLATDYVVKFSMQSYVAKMLFSKSHVVYVDLLLLSQPYVVKSTLRGRVVLVDAELHLPPARLLKLILRY